jgi:hypothetical protein
MAGLVYIGSQPLSCTLLRYDGLLVAFSSSTDSSVWQFALAVNRSVKSLSVKALSPWKLMLRDGLNLYAVSLFPYQ